MLYTFFVLMFGIYLGQEYPQIPSVKTTVQTLIEKFGNENELTQASSNQQQFNQEEQSSSGAFERIIVPKRNYRSLPIWISSWWSSSGENSPQNSEDDSDMLEKKKTE